jgi:type I protein arginine methyltransferase
MLFSSDDIMRRSPMHIPVLSDTGRARLIVLDYCDGVRTSRQIEEAVLRDNPNLFPSTAEAVQFITQVLMGDAL